MGSNSRHLKFEILALDPNEETHCRDSQSLIHTLRGFSELWESPSISESECCIRDGGTSLKVMSIKHNFEDESSEDFGRAFSMALVGSYNDIESMRAPLTEFLKNSQKFKMLYVVKDKVSQEIACELYPYLYRIENLLRGYLIKFMSTRIGPGWWEKTVTKEVDLKAKQRKKNELVFGKHVDNSAYLIDFGELGEIVYTQTSGLVTKKDIVERIQDLAETREAIVALKNELRTNYQRFFKESFADRSFDKKWKAFESLRNKIAHNNLFTHRDLETGKSVATEIEEIISEAEKQTPQIIITPKEREAIQDTVAQSSSSEWLQISEDEFVEQLTEQEKKFSKAGGFVGISRFIKSHLVYQGYDSKTSHDVLSTLEKKGIIEVYSVKNPDNDRDVSAIRLSEKGNISGQPALVRPAYAINTLER